MHPNISQHMLDVKLLAFVHDGFIETLAWRLVVADTLCHGNIQQLRCLLH